MICKLMVSTNNKKVKVKEFKSIYIHYTTFINNGIGWNISRENEGEGECKYFIKISFLEKFDQ